MRLLDRLFGSRRGRRSTIQLPVEGMDLTMVEQGVVPDWLEKSSNHRLGQNVILAMSMLLNAVERFAQLPADETAFDLAVIALDALSRGLHDWHCQASRPLVGPRTARSVGQERLN